MSVTLNVSDSNGEHVTTLELFDDVYAHMQLESALIGVPVGEHIIQIITGYAHDIINGLRDDE